MTDLWKKRWMLGAVLIGVILIGSLILKQSGFHIQNLSLVRGGEIVLASFDENARVFLDNKRVRVEQKEDGEGIVRNASPGEHSVLYFRDGYWPWLKSVTVETGTTTVIAPFFIQKNVDGVIVTKEDETYAAMKTAFLDAGAPTKDSPALSKDGKVKVWTDANRIIAEWLGQNEPPFYFCDSENVCTNTITVTESTTPVRNVAFFKDRNNVLLIASQNGVFAIELDRRGATQNFQPVYKGTGLPQFIATDEETVYILDGELMFKVTL